MVYSLLFCGRVISFPGKSVKANKVDCNSDLCVDNELFDCGSRVSVLLAIPTIAQDDCVFLIYVDWFFLWSASQSFRYVSCHFRAARNQGGIGAKINGAVGIGSLRFNSVLLFYSNAIITSIAILSIFKYAEQKTLHLKWLSMFGKESIVILCTNNLLIETIRLLDYKITGNFLLNYGLLGCLVFTGILAILEYGIIRMTRQRFIRLLFGKRGNNT